MAKKHHTYTKEQKEWLIKTSGKYVRDEVHERFCKKFNVNVSKRALNSYRSRNGIKAKRLMNKGNFKKGHKTWNKGMKGIQLGGEEGWFKSGNESNKWRPVGSERLDKGTGYTRIKVAEPDVWERKHIYLWEKEHGEVPKGYLVIFADNNKSNFDIENLICVSRGQLRRLHHNGLIKDDAELTKTGLNIVKVIEKVAEIEKDG